MRQWAWELMGIYVTQHQAVMYYNGKRKARTEGLLKVNNMIEAVHLRWSWYLMTNGMIQ